MGFHTIPLAKAPVPRRAVSTLKSYSYGNTTGSKASTTANPTTLHNIMKQTRLSPLAANKYTAQKLQSMDPDLIMNPFTNLISVSLDQENHRSQAPSPAAKNQKQLHQQYFKGDQHGHSFKVVLQKSTNGEI